MRWLFALLVLLGLHTQTTSLRMRHHARAAPPQVRPQSSVAARQGWTSTALRMQADNNGFGEPDDRDDEDDEEQLRRRAVPDRRRAEGRSPRMSTTRNVRNPKRWRAPLLPNDFGKALLAGVFVVGVGTGVTVDSAINTNPRDLASRDAIDRQAPNPNLCQAYGMSALAMDSRIFVTFNPFSVYIAQSDVKPACVLRPSNIVQVLGSRSLITREELIVCKNSNNTWAFVGDIEDEPQVSCVWESEEAQNEFLSPPKQGIGEDIYDDDRVKALKKKATRKEITDRERKLLQQGLFDTGEN